MATTERAIPRRKLRGTPRPREEMLAQYAEENSARRRSIDPVLWQFWAPDPDEIFHWRIRLDCGCVHDVLTRGDGALPLGPWWGGQPRCVLPEGQYPCAQHGVSHWWSNPLREVVSWGESSRVELGVDPTGPPDWWAEAFPEDVHHLWDVLRRRKPKVSVRWTVKLDCGHTDEVVADEDWTPEQGPHFLTGERQAEMLAEALAEPVNGPGGTEHRLDVLRRIRAGWPRPDPLRRCYTCTVVRQITAYESVGWLVPRKPPPKPPEPPEVRLQRRLTQAERDLQRAADKVAELKHQLNQP